MPGFSKFLLKGIMITFLGVLAVGYLASKDKPEPLKQDVFSEGVGALGLLPKYDVGFGKCDSIPYKTPQLKRDSSSKNSILAEGHIFYASSDEVAISKAQSLSSDCKIKWLNSVRRQYTNRKRSDRTYTALICSDPKYCPKHLSP